MEGEKSSSEAKRILDVEEGEGNTLLSVVFLCSANSCRSQMGEGWLRFLYGDLVLAFSAGASPGSAVDPLAIQVMKEIGIDISDAYPKSLKEAQNLLSSASPRVLNPDLFDLVITVCDPAAEACPRNGLFSKLVLHRSFNDPPALVRGTLPLASDPLPVYRKVRDEIGAYLKDQLPLEFPELLARLAQQKKIEETVPLSTKEDQGVEEDNSCKPISDEHQDAPPVDLHHQQKQQISFFEKYLSVWVLVCMIVGALIGYFVPSISEAFAKAEFSHISVPMAVLLWVMIFPMLIQIDFTSIKRVKEHPGALLLTTTVNYAIKPFTMYGIALLFFNVIFKSVIDDSELSDSYIAGCILLGAAPCTAMVFVWSLLTEGDAGYTLVQVAVNDLIMLGLYVPICLALLRVSSIPIPFDTIALAVALFVGAPMILAVLFRKFVLQSRGEEFLHKVIHILRPFTIVALLLTLVLIFIFQGGKIGSRPVHIFLIALPLLLQTLLNFSICYFIGYKFCLPHPLLAPASLVATSNFFELAVAVAVSLYGLDSGAALATVVGVLIEVPVMLVLVKFCNYFRPRLEKRIEVCICPELKCGKGASSSSMLPLSRDPGASEGLRRRFFRSKGPPNSSEAALVLAGTKPEPDLTDLAPGFPSVGKGRRPRSTAV